MFGSDLVRIVGVDSYVRTRSRELRAFQQQQLPLMRKAGAVVRAEERSILKSGAPLQSGTGRKNRKLGPLATKVRLRVTRTLIDVQARIDFAGRGFYGRFHETGLDVQTQGRRTGQFTRNKRNQKKAIRSSSYAFHLPKRETLAPAGKKTEPQVLEILGDSYAVFTP